MAGVKKIFIILSAITVLSLAQHGKSVYAAQPDGLTVSPAFQQITIAAGASQQPVSFKLTNNLKVAQDLSLSVADFNSLNESGGLFFVGTNPTALQKKYGLAKWFSLPQNQITVPPKQTITVHGNILNLPDLSPGGHYGALMISLDSSNSQSGQVGIHPIATSLLFVTKPAGATHSLNLSNVYLKHSLTKLPNSATLRFQNDGNTHLIPRGTVSITTSGGKLISKGVINQASALILPGTYRQYTVPLKKVASADTGNYKIKVDFRFDGIDQFRSYQSSFWYVSLSTILFGMLIILLIVIFYLIKLKVISKIIKKTLKK